MYCDPLRQADGSYQSEERLMTRLRVNSFTISLDGYGAGPNQSMPEPLGVGGEQLHEWLVGTRTFNYMEIGRASCRERV